MNDELKDYDCVAAVRKSRERIDAQFAHDPEAWFRHLDGVPEAFFKSLNITNEWFK